MKYKKKTANGRCIFFRYFLLFYYWICNKTTDLNWVNSKKTRVMAKKYNLFKTIILELVMWNESCFIQCTFISRLPLSHFCYNSQTPPSLLNTITYHHLRLTIFNLLQFFVACLHKILNEEVSFDFDWQISMNHSILWVSKVCTKSK